MHDDFVCDIDNAGGRESRVDAPLHHADERALVTKVRRDRDDPRWHELLH
jgi:hypothetical protein